MRALLPLLLAPLLGGCLLPMPAPDVYQRREPGYASAFDPASPTRRGLEATFHRAERVTRVHTAPVMIEGNPVRFRYPATRLSASIACAGDVQGCAADQVTLTFYGISGGWRWSRDRSVAFLSDGERWEVADAQVRRTTDVLTGSLVSERLEVALTREQFARLADSVSGVVLGRVELPLHPDHRAGLQALADALANWSRL